VAAAVRAGGRGGPSWLCSFPRPRHMRRQRVYSCWRRGLTSPRRGERSTTESTRVRGLLTDREPNPLTPPSACGRGSRPSLRHEPSPHQRLLDITAIIAPAALVFLKPSRITAGAYDKTHGRCAGAGRSRPDLFLPRAR